MGSSKVREEVEKVSEVKVLVWKLKNREVFRGCVG